MAKKHNKIPKHEEIEDSIMSNRQRIFRIFQKLP